MNNKLAVTMIALMAIGLGLSSIVPSVMADSKGKKQDLTDLTVPEFVSALVVDSSSTTEICHIPKGNTGNAHEIVVSTSSLTAHFKHGDNIGICEG